MPHQLQKLTANLVVSDVERSLAFDRDVLGCSVTATVRNSPSKILTAT